MLCEKMKLSESIAGATLLAFGEASPDVFTALAESKSDFYTYSMLDFLVSWIFACILHAFQFIYRIISF